MNCLGIFVCVFEFIWYFFTLLFWKEKVDSNIVQHDIWCRSTHTYDHELNEEKWGKKTHTTFKETI